MGESGIATKHLATACIHHAAADRFIKLELDRVEAPEQRMPPVLALLCAI